MSENTNQVKLPPISFLSSINNQSSNPQNNNTQSSINSNSPSANSLGFKLPGLSSLDSRGYQNENSNSLQENTKFQLPSLSNISSLPTLHNPDHSQGSTNKDDLSSYKFPLPKPTTTVQPKITNGNDYNNSTILEPNETTILQNESTIIDANITTANITSNQILPESIEEEQEEKQHRHHHLHHLHHHQQQQEQGEERPLLVHSQQVDAETIPEVPPKQPSVTVNSREVLELASQFPRENLGYVIYQEYPTRSTVMRHIKGIEEVDSHEEDNDINGINKILPRIELLPLNLSTKINSLIDIHIPFSSIPNNSNVFNRKIWGTDIYTDDSDIISILYHCGILKSINPEEQYDEVINHKTIKKERGDDSIGDDGTTPGNLENGRDIKYIGNLPKDEYDELIVTMIILPTLSEYKGSYRNNYNSRDWSKTRHNGASIAIHEVKWCKLNQSVNLLSFQRGIKRKLIDEDVSVFEKLMYGKSKDGESTEINSWSK